MTNEKLFSLEERAKRNRAVRFMLLFISAALTGLCLVISKIGIIEWLTLVPCALFLLTLASDKETRLRTLYGYGLFFFMIFYTVNFHWFVNLYPLDFIDGMTKGAALAVVLVAWIGLSFFQAVQGALVFVLSGLVFRSSLCRRFPLLKPFALGAIWAVYEWLQTFGWWGVPWGRLPLGQAEYVVGLQTASWFGPYFITFLIASVNALVAYALLNRQRIKVCCIVIASILIFQYGAGTALMTFGKRDTETVRMAAVQGNISSNEKWSSSSTKRTLEVYKLYTEEAARQGAQIVVWPETALPYTITEGDANYRFVSSLAKENRVTILVGAFSPSEEAGEYNSVLCFLPDGAMLDTVYSKRRLVPFGEFVPMKKLFQTVVPPLAELVMSEDDVVQGEGAQVFVTDSGSIGSLICFDSIYEGLSRDSALDGAEVIALSTNDSWFTDSAALYMHNAQAQLRAIETGRYVVRAANTGISTVISSNGEVLEELPPLVDGMVIHDVELNGTPTLYTLTGNIVVYLFGLAIVLTLLWETYTIIRKKTVERLDEKRRV